MELIPINWLAVGVAFVVVFLAGAVWFGPKTFFPVWWRALGKDPDDMGSGGMNMAVIFGGTAIAAAVQVIGIALAIGVATLAFGAVGPVGGLLIGFTLGVVFTAAGSLSHRLFGQQGFRVWLIEVGSDVLNYTLAGLIIGLFG
ncbi:DUF1761 domain-containing protein [Microcella alkaliphila]|jgi:hypothetical protein|uniref:DUF1761 domain-containing protein n=1 Tax=Microcella alkaliphila TaxID=279828 RepID=A0A0U5BJL6_9MICO|nr:DUF1761 domain-containing protein [Microcella alkaliphila]BAU31765.1 uncharacterized protein MalAC0309_0899 [Microcella alkaliphila]